MELEQIAQEIRAEIVKMSFAAKTPHLGSSLSCVDIVVAALFGAMRIDPARPSDPDRDRLILSKGHAATTLYAALAHRGFYSRELLSTYSRPGSTLAEHPSPGCAPGVEAATGSLGHGLSLALGMGLAGRMQGRSYRLFVVLSDGECNEGSVWEAALLGGAQRLERVVAIIDYNKWQATGRTNEVMALDPLRSKWEAFGWSTYEVDGHDLGALVRTLRQTPDGSGKPVAVVANTVKGKGVSFMEDDNNWHYRIPDAKQLELALSELGSV